MNDSIDDLKRKLAAAHKAKDMFLSTVSHELRSPLSTMLMHAQMLKAGDLTPEEQKKTGEAIERATNRQTQTIDELFDVARALAGALPHQAQALSLASVARGAVDNLTAQATRKGVTLTFDAQATADVTGDLQRLTQVVRHLVGNALRFTMKGGVIAVTVTEEGADAVVRVRDAGPGVEAAWHPFLFNRLTEPDAPDRPKPQGGIGYGLSISHYIVVDQHKGALALESSTAEGSTFALRIPLAPPRSNKA